METKRLLGLVLSLVGAGFGVVGTFVLFTNWYIPMMLAEAAAEAPGCEVMVGLILPIVSDLGLLAGFIYLISALGFFEDASWAFPAAVIANVMALNASFWPMIPAMATHLPPVWMIIFLPNVIIYFTLLIKVGNINWITTLIALLTGMAYVTSFLNGVAATNRMTVLSILYEPVTHPAWTIFVALERLNWVAAITWGLVTIGLILKPSHWVRLLGVGAGFLEIFAGSPLGISSPFASNFGPISMFLLAPALSFLLLVFFLFPRFHQKFIPELVE